MKIVVPVTNVVKFECGVASKNAGCLTDLFSRAQNFKVSTWLCGYLQSLSAAKVEISNAKKVY